MDRPNAGVTPTLQRCSHVCKFADSRKPAEDGKKYRSCTEVLLKVTGTHQGSGRECRPGWMCPAYVGSVG